MSGFSNSPKSGILSGLSMLRHPRAEEYPTLFTEYDPLPPSQRLVILLPESGIDLLTLPQRIWELAAPDGRRVLLVAKSSLEDNEFSARMNLATVAALVRDSRVSVETLLVQTGRLDQAALKLVQPGDLLVCFYEHRVQGIFKKQRLADVLAKNCSLPIYTLQGQVYQYTWPTVSPFAGFLLFLVGLATVAGFFAVQVWIDRHTAGAARTALQVLSVIAEIWIVAACASVERPA